jgi:hypothetical protein
MFDLILGFSGEGTLPEHVMNEMQDLIRDVTINCGTDIWALLNTTFKHTERLLHHTPLVAIFKDKGVVRSIELGLHEPPSRVLGVKLWCGAPGGQCRPGPGDLTYKTCDVGTPKECIKQKCRRCGYSSAWVAVREISWVHRLPGSRRVFWHNYPVTPQQQMIFAPAADTESSDALSLQPRQKRGRGMSMKGGKETKKRKSVSGQPATS